MSSKSIYKFKPNLRKNLAIDLSVLLIIFVFLSIAPIDTRISISHMIVFGTCLSAAVLAPYFFYKNTSSPIKFPFALRGGWTKNKLLYIGFAISITYLLFPFYFASTGAYLNWPKVNSFGELTLLFIGTNALGIWDELFFINTVLTILRRHLSFWRANFIQAIFFTLFLYELGFTGWAPLMIYPFALIQGYTYKKFESLYFVIAIHLAVDFVLFLAILNAHGQLPFNLFITG